MMREFANRHLPLSITWQRVAREVGLSPSRIEAVRETPLGFEVILRIAPPVTVAKVGLVNDVLAVAYAVARVRVTGDETSADRVHVFFDYATSLPSTPLPNFHHPYGIPCEAGQPIQFGIDDNGGSVAISLVGHGALIGGNPGSGKSNTLRVLLAGLSNQRNVALYGIDPKRAELVMWRNRFSGLVLGHDPQETIELLEVLIQEIHRRAEYLSTTGRATLLPSEQHPAIILVVDEWAEVAAVGTKAERQMVEALIRRFVSIGRAVICSALIAVLRPTSDTSDITTRSLLSHRIALRCGDRHQADAILGVGVYDPAQLVGATPGKALWSNGGPAKSVQVHVVDDEVVPSLVCAGYRPRPWIMA